MVSHLRPGIIFDFDDTLVCSHAVFEAVQTQYCLRMRQLGLYDDGLPLALNVQDIANVDATGYMAAHCFPKALGQTYDRYCDKYSRTKNPAVREELVQLGWQVYEQQPQEMADARTLLKELRSGHYGNYHLLLLTQGEQEIQKRRLAGSGLAEYFDAVHIVPRKNAAVLRWVVQEEALSIADTWYVGNSMRSDINPALEVGLRAVHLDIKAWDYEHQEPCGKYLVINKLGQLTDLLKKQAEDYCESSGDSV